jgi:hypothetical protein
MDTPNRFFRRNSKVRARRRTAAYPSTLASWRIGGMSFRESVPEFAHAVLRSTDQVERFGIAPVGLKLHRRTEDGSQRLNPALLSLPVVPGAAPGRTGTQWLPMAGSLVQSVNVKQI